MSSKKEKIADAKAKLKAKMKKAGNALTNSKFFLEKVDAAWEACDIEKTGKVNKDGLYAGIIFIHLKLAEAAGPAACHPPSREVCDKFFEAADADGSGTVEKEEFLEIVTVLTAQIFKRMLAYYALMIVIVPTVAVGLVSFIGSRTKLPGGKLVQKVAEHVATGYFATQVIPKLFGKIDDKAHKKMLEKVQKDE